MSRAASPFTERLYDAVRVRREWKMMLSSFYHQRGLAGRRDCARAKKLVISRSAPHSFPKPIFLCEPFNPLPLRPSAG